jgi:signal peptidase I
VTRGEAKVLLFENQTISTLRNNKKRDQNKPIGLNLTQSSAPSPQSFNLTPLKFVKICTELLHQGHQVEFKAPGDSMYPTICDGDLITVETIKPAAVIAGDIILYEHKSKVTVHRVMRILKRSEKNLRSALQGPQDRSLSETLEFIFRGDAAIHDDAPVSSEQILGKVVSIERNGRRIDPYRLRIQLHYYSRRLASRIKRLFLRPNSISK